MILQEDILFFFFNLFISPNTFGNLRVVTQVITDAGKLNFHVIVVD